MGRKGRHLVAHGRKDAALKSIIFYHNVDEAEAVRILDEIRDSQQSAAKPLSMLEVLRDPQARRGTIVGSVCFLAFIFNGIAGW